jgi:hypothetical protein
MRGSGHVQGNGLSSPAAVTSRSDWEFLSTEVPGQRENPTEWDDECSECYCGGNMVMCDSCPRAFHLKCLATLGVKDGVGADAYIPPAEPKLFFCL